MAQATRFYKVEETNKAGDVKSTRLVIAANPAQVLRHVATPMFQISVCDSAEAFNLGSAGVKAEQAATE